MDESRPADHAAEPGGPSATGSRPPLSIGACVRASWQAYWRHPWLSVALIIASAIVKAISDDSIWRLILGLVFGPPIYGGMWRLAINIVEERNPSAADLLSGFQRWGRFVAAYVLLLIAVLVLCLPLIVPLVVLGLATTWMRPDAWATAAGIAGAAGLAAGATVIGSLLLFAVIRLQFVGYLIADSAQVSPVEAIRRSWAMTRGSWWRLLGLGLTLIALQIVGALCLIVGLLVTLPMMMLGIAAAYVRLRPADLRVDAPIASAPPTPVAAPTPATPGTA